MKRIPTMSINPWGMSMSKIIPNTLGHKLSFAVDKDKGEIHISTDPGEHMALVTYPEMIPIIKSVPLIKWIKGELGERNYSKMPIELRGNEFIVKVGEK
jgi:hypothetical protein